MRKWNSADRAVAFCAFSVAFSLFALLYNIFE